ncbi:MAG: histidine kinase, partial [Thermoanaerobaculia bacterium]|nr:histidine kinase [Thermoanaerobaculia bacterium]
MAGALLAAAQGLGVAATECLTRRDAAAALTVPLGVLAATGWISLGVVYFPNLVATFPTGVALSDRWRRLWWISGTAALLLGMVATLGPLYAFDTRVNPIGLLPPGPALAVFNIGLALWALAILAAGAALVLRYIRSRGDERQQLKWAAVGVVFAAAANLVGNLLDQGDLPSELTGVIKVVPVFVLLPIILIITVFRHRLYDVDVVINRAVMVALLASAITAIYLGVTLGVGALLGTSEIGFDLQVGAAVAVAVAFNPVYQRARRLANRIVFGVRATPYEVLARFSHRAAEVSDDQVLDRIPRLVVDGTGAAAATLWVRSGDRMQPVAAWPEGAARDPIDVSGDFVDPAADYSLPIRNAGELLGSLSLSKQRGETMPPAEERLLEGLATGLGVVLRNTALRSELRDQVEALSASRDRVVAAADEARRALERDLDSGPQQRLVAIKVMLGPIRKQAERAGAEKTAQILAQLEDDAGAAIQSVREFAGGIYPPLLEAEGLATAVAHQAGRAPVPVAVEAGDLGRHPREVEAAAYFTILEALQNAVKHAGASAVEVTI